MVIIAMFLASAMILPVGLSYATTNSTSQNMTGNSGTNQTSMNKTAMMSPGMNQTGMNNTSMNSGMNKTGMMPPGTNQTAMDQYAMLHHGMNKTMPTNSTVSTPKMLPPLEQVKSGVLPKDVQCKQGFTLLLKAEDGSPACVDPAVAQILIQRGW